MMNNAINVRILQGDPVIHDVRNAQLPPLFRGMPSINDAGCPQDCRKCADACPTNAIDVQPVRVDLGKCIFCPLCEESCPDNVIHFTDDPHLAASTTDQLIVTREHKHVTPEKASEEIRKYFGRSLKLRQISAGGCNGCELELNALSNPNFDMGRYGIEFTASPRHADGVVITGPITRNMASAVKICYDAVPNPKIIILAGACAISGGIFHNSHEIQRSFIDKNKIDLFVPGCPPHPLTFINGLLDWLGRKK
jgi:Ni,Fe-hydrogenase III small subunit/NAD-dependent dihydropyrimidine dehydrogenase PreA subunit